MNGLQRYLWKLRLRQARKRCGDTPLQPLLDGLPDLKMPAGQQCYLALDFETTGLDPDRDAILSIGWVPVENGRVLAGQGVHHIIRIDQPLSEESIKIHGITHQRMNAGRPIAEVLPQLFTALKNHVALVHSAPIERRFLERACPRWWGCAPTLPMVDTLALARRRLPQAQWAGDSNPYRLYNLRRRFHLPDYPPHHALEDAIATAELLLALLHHFPDWQGVPTWDLLS